MTKNIKQLKSLAHNQASLGYLGFILLAAFLVTFLSFFDSSIGKNSTTTKSDYQVKRDFYDIRIEDRTASTAMGLETGF
jgi:hypothetical protein